MARRKDGQETEEKLLQTALRLFREQGFEKTSMRQIAKETELSPGAAYHYFPSKTDIVQAYYEEHQSALEGFCERELPASASLEDRIAILFHKKLQMLSEDRALIIALSHHIATPGDPLCAFGPDTRALKERNIAMLESLCASERLSAPVRKLLPSALWALQMAITLYFAFDESANASRSHALVDNASKQLSSWIKLAGLPLGKTLVARLVQTVEEAGLISPQAPKKTVETVNGGDE